MTKDARERKCVLNKRATDRCGWLGRGRVQVCTYITHPAQKLELNLSLQSQQSPAVSKACALTASPSWPIYRWLSSVFSQIKYQIFALSQWTMWRSI